MYVLSLSGIERPKSPKCVTVIIFSQSIHSFSEKILFLVNVEDQRVCERINR